MHVLIRSEYASSAAGQAAQRVPMVGGPRQPGQLAREEKIKRRRQFTETAAEYSSFTGVHFLKLQLSEVDELSRLDIIMHL